MPIWKKIKAFFKPERIIDPLRHHAEHEKFYKVARDLQKIPKYSKKKDAIARAKVILGIRKEIKFFMDKGFTRKEAEALAKRVLKVPTVKITPIEKAIIEAHTP